MPSKIKLSLLAASVVAFASQQAHAATTYPVDLCEPFYSALDPSGHGLWDPNDRQADVEAARRCVANGDPLGPATLAYALMNKANSSPESLLEAKSILDQGRRLGADEASLSRMECIVLRRQKKIRDAIQLCQRAVEINPKVPIAYVTLSNALYESGDSRQALLVAQQGLKQAPDYGLLLLRYGSLLSESGDWSSALSYLERAQKSNPRSIEAAIDLIQAYYRTSPPSYDRGISILTNVLMAKPIARDREVASLYYHRGYMLELSGDKKSSLIDYGKAVQLDPQNAQYRWDKGYTLFLIGRYDEAEKELDRALAINPKFSQAERAKAQIAMRKGDFSKARKGFDRALELDPKDAANWKYSGELHMRLENYQQGLQHLEKASQMLPNDATVWHNRGMAFYELGKINEAIDSISRAIQIDPRQEGGGSYFWRARAYSLIGKVPEAVEDYTKLVSINPGYLWGWRNRAELRFHLRDMKGAFEDFERVSKTRPRELEMDWFLWALSGLESGVKHQDLLQKLRDNPASEMPSGMWAEALLLALGGDFLEAEAAYLDASEATPQYAKAADAADIINRFLSKENISSYPLDNRYKNWTPPKFSCAIPEIPSPRTRESTEKFNRMVERYNDCSQNWLSSVGGGSTRRILGADFDAVSPETIMSMKQKINQIWDSHIVRMEALNDEIRGVNSDIATSNALNNIANTMTAISRSLPKPKRYQNTTMPFISPGQR